MLHEKWTRRRSESVLTGHETEHFIDVPLTKREYDAFITGWSPKTYSVATDPMYFNQHLHRETRRELLIEVCGDVDITDVVEREPSLAGLPGVLNGRSVNDHRKVLRSKRTELNKALEQIPTRIDEVLRGLPELENDDKQAVEST